MAQGICSTLLSATLLIQRKTCRKKRGDFELGVTGPDFACCVPVSSCSEIRVLWYVRLIDGFGLGGVDIDMQYLKLTGPKLALIKTLQSSNAIRSAPKPLCILRLGWARWELRES